MKKFGTGIRGRQSALPAPRHLPLVDILVDAQAELQELVVASGLKVLAAMLEADRVAVCGPRGIVNLVRAARSCPVTSTPPIVLSRRTSPHPIQRTRGCGADGGEPTAGGVDRLGRDSARYREPTRTAGAERPT